MATELGYDMDLSHIRRIMDEVIRERLVNKYTEEVMARLLEDVEKKREEVRRQIYEDLQDVTLDVLRKEKDMFSFADRLIVGFGVNLGDGDPITETREL